VPSFDVNDGVEAGEGDDAKETGVWPSLLSTLVLLLVLLPVTVVPITPILLGTLLTAATLASVESLPPPTPVVTCRRGAGRPRIILIGGKADDNDGHNASIVNSKQNIATNDRWKHKARQGGTNIAKNKKEERK
jgi:hypothetical protein